MSTRHAFAMTIVAAFAATTVRAGTASPATELKDPGPALQVAASPTTPAQALPEQKTKIPPRVKYVAHLSNITGTVPARLGGWECSSGEPKCMLTTTGPATQIRLRELCRALWSLGREKRIKFKISEFHAYSTPPEPRLTLDRPGIASCNG